MCVGGGGGGEREQDSEREKEKRLSIEMQESIGAKVVAEGLTLGAKERASNSCSIQESKWKKLHSMKPFS